jgi:glycosyltransferase involved in cell wall biosynthesis
MRVLVVAEYLDAVTETYVHTESEWLARQPGVEVGIWAPERHPLPSMRRRRLPWPRERTYLDGQGVDLGHAITHFHPDVVHAHWLTFALRAVPAVAAARACGRRVALTCRAHSFEWRANVRQALEQPAIDVIWAFPHYVRTLQPDAGWTSSGRAPELRCLTACCDLARWRPSGSPERTYVLRVAAGLPAKGLDEHLEIARLCPRIPFVLAIGSCSSEGARLAARAPANVRVLRDVDPDDVPALAAGASLYLRGHGHAHAPGWPVSVAEALASGLPVAAPAEVPWLGACGGAALPYRDSAWAAALVRAWFEATEGARAERRELALEAARALSTDAVLPDLVATWRRLLAR